MARAITAARLRELRAMPYADYLQTPEWRHRRNVALARASWQCEWPDCERKTGLQVHHKSYEHIGGELSEELTVLCDEHHDGFHRKYQPNGPGSILLVLIRDVFWRAVSENRHYTSTADLLADVKALCAENHIEYGHLSNVFSVLERELTLAPVPPPAPLLLPTAPLIDHREACEILARLKVQVRGMPPADLVSQRTADIAKASGIVLAEIEASLARCRALESNQR